jgi:hypothetical protein
MLYLRDQHTFKIQFGTDSMIALEGRHKMSCARVRRLHHTFIPREENCPEQQRSGVKSAQGGPADLDASEGRSRSNGRATEGVEEEN